MPKQLAIFKYAEQKTNNCLNMVIRTFVCIRDQSGVLQVSRTVKFSELANTFLETGPKNRLIILKMQKTSYKQSVRKFNGMALKSDMDANLLLRRICESSTCWISSRQAESKKCRIRLKSNSK